MNAAPRISPRTNPQTELARALALRGSARKEQLNQLSQQHPDHAPIWVALAEEHLADRRREEAVYAVRRALRIDRDCDRHFSPELAQAAAHLVPPRVAGERPASPRLIALEQRHVSDPDAELKGAKALSGNARRERLIELTHQAPNHGPTWLALAEENLAQRRAARAVSALERALQLDPGLERLISPRLETAYRLHKKASHERPGIRPSAARADEATRQAKFKPQPWQPGSAVAMPPVGVPAIHEEAPSASNPRVGKMLARALELRDPSERLAMLRELWAMAPDHPGVLFHVAIESALAGHTDDARRAGRSLQTISPERYAQLYAVAESYWPSGQGGFQSSLSQPQAPYVPEGLVKQQSTASARTVCMQVPSLGAMPVSFGHASHPVMQLSVAGEPQKTQILSIPLPPVARMMPAVGPELLPPAPVHVHAQRPRNRRWRTAGALTAGVAAGLLFAMLMVFVLGRVDAVDAPRPVKDTVQEPALVQKTDKAEGKAQDIDPMFMLTP